MTPNILKGDKYSSSLPKDRYDDPNHPRNNSAFTSNNNMSGNAPDGDHTAKGLDAGANSSTNTSEFAEGIYEGAHQGTSAGEKATGQGTSIFNKEGAVGGAFTSKGAIGGTVNMVGGPLANDGMIGKQFEAGGAIGSAFQNLAKKNEEH